MIKKRQSDYIRINGLKIHYYRTGGDLPQVILNHGALDDGSCWPRLAGALENEYDLIMPDARGHGKSDHGAGDYSARSRANDLIGLIEVLDLDQPVVGGHSIGGVTSLYAAALRPDLISGFFMEDPPITAQGEFLFGGQPVKDNQMAMRRLIRAWQLIKALPGFLALPLAKRLMPTATPDVIQTWLESKQRVSEDFVNALADPDWLTIREDDEYFDQIQLPGLLIYGQRSRGAIVSTGVAETVAERIEGLRIEYIAGAAHDIRRTHFDQYLASLRDFLGKIYYD